MDKPIDIEALAVIARAVSNDPWDWIHHTTNDRERAFAEAFNPATALALIAKVEHAHERVKAAASWFVLNHPLPWTIEKDWTWEILDSRGGTVLKCQTSSEAEEWVVLANEIADERIRRNAMDALVAETERLGLHDDATALERKEPA